MDVHNQRLILASQNPKAQSKTTVTNSSANSCNSFVMYTSVVNLINKRSELLTIISADNPDVIYITDTFPKHTHLPMKEYEQVFDYDCFSNTTDSNCHRGVVIYVKKYLNSFCINQTRLKEYSCCKIVLKGNIDPQTVQLTTITFSTKQLKIYQN